MEEPSGGWVIAQSAALELDFALLLVSGSGAITSLSDEARALMRSVPGDWRAQWPEVLGDPHRGLTVLEPIAALAGVLLEGDYSRATLAMRELTVEAALERLAGEAAAYELTPDTTLSPSARLSALAFRVQVVEHETVGLTPQPDLARRWEQALVWVPRLLRDGDLHSRFWHWLDRFYYEVYRPWRAERIEVVRRQEQQARIALTAPTGSSPPPLDWLDAPNPLLRHPELRAAVEAGQLRVCFWAEPFGLVDAWLLHPGLAVVSFAAPDLLYERFQARAAGVAGRAAALGDPTRLIILRLIRHFGMVNTEIADYLGLARPTVSVHAKILREAGLIRSHEEGRRVRHELAPGAVRQFFRDLEQFLDLPPEEPPA